MAKSYQFFDYCYGLGFYRRIGDLGLRRTNSYGYAAQGDLENTARRNLETGAGRVGRFRLDCWRRTDATGRVAAPPRLARGDTIQNG